MFVIVQCLNNLENEDNFKDMDRVEKVGLTMKHAGVAITITSLTDFVVFAVGATTVSESRFRRDGS